MYLSYYNLKHKPFQISTDPGFLWLGEKHMEALATLRYGVMDNKGFLLLTGDVGTGKTTLINALLKTLEDDVLVACVRDPGLKPLDFFTYTASVFGMKQEVTSKGSFLLQFEKFLISLYEKNQKALLIIDEAQRIDQELLEEVRLLSNIEKSDTKLLNIFFVGQIEFNDILLRSVNRPIRQRITVNYNIETLSEYETEKYIRHRLQIAGRGDLPAVPEPQSKNGSDIFVQERLPSHSSSDGPEIFTNDAIHEIYLFSNGYPRLINIICDRCLLTGFVEESQFITRKHVRECTKELEIPYFGLKEKNSEPQNESAAGEAHLLTEKRTPDLEVAIDSNDENNPSFPENAPLQVWLNRDKKNRKSKRVSAFSAAVVAIIIVVYFFLAQKPGFSRQVVETFTNSTLVEYLTKRWHALADSSADQQQGRVVKTAAEEQSSIATQNGSNTPAQPLENMSVKKKTGSQGQSLPIILDKLIMPFAEDAALPPLQSLTNLNMVIEYILSQSSVKVLINGYADTQKDESLNRQLSQIKANSIKIYLISKGVDESQIEIRGLGSQSPLTPGSTPSGRAANQRVEVEIYH